MTRHAATATEPDRDGTGLYPHETPARYDPHVRDAWSRLGKPPTYAQAWLSAAVLAALVGAAFSAVGILAGWQLPWPQFAVLMPGLVPGPHRPALQLRHTPTPRLQPGPLALPDVGTRPTQGPATRGKTHSHPQPRRPSWQADTGVEQAANAADRKTVAAKAHEYEWSGLPWARPWSRSSPGALPTTSAPTPSPAAWPPTPAPTPPAPRDRMDSAGGLQDPGQPQVHRAHGLRPPPHHQHPLHPRRPA